MKLIILIFSLFITTAIHADDMKVKAVIFNKLITSITKKMAPRVYIHTQCSSLEKYPGNLELIDTCDDADIIVASTLKDLPAHCFNILILAMRYSHLKDPRVLGAFFWQKGRPNILFYQKQLDKFDVILDRNLHKYIEQ